jgi:L-rhamnose mutarotase
MERILMYIRIFPGAEAAYDTRHAEVWPELVAEIQESGVRNYTAWGTRTRSGSPPKWSMVEHRPA